MTTKRDHVRADNGFLGGAEVPPMTSPRELYRRIAEAAATLEQRGNHAEAAKQWYQAGLLAPGPRSRFWCEVRYTLCLRCMRLEAYSLECEGTEYRQARRGRTER